MSEIDLIEGTDIPVLNDHNKLLQSQIQEKEKKINACEAQIQEHDDRVQALTDHSKNVRQELQHTQAVCDARKREIETEDHMKQIAEREEGRLKAEKHRVAVELADLHEKMNSYENSIFRTAQQIEQIKEQMKWDQEALDQWIAVAERRDEDAIVLQKYTRIDDSKTKELQLQLERLAGESDQKRHGLDSTVTDVLTTQIELDKTADLFRHSHQQRETLIEQWEQTVNQMKKRDMEINQTAQDLTQLKMNQRELEAALHEKQAFLESEINNNQEQDKQIGLTERQVAKLRLEYQAAETSQLQFQDELETLKYSVERTNTDLQSTRAEAHQLKQQLKQKKQRLEIIHEERLYSQETLKKMVHMTLSAEEFNQRMEEKLSANEKLLQEVQKTLEQKREVQFRQTQQLYDVKEKATNAEAEIQGNRAAVRNLNSKLNKVDQESLKQQELIYSQDFQLQHLERKVARLQGERSNEEKVALNLKIKELAARFDEQQGTETMLQNQLKRLGDDLRRATRGLEKARNEKFDLTSKIEELELHNDSSQRELKKVEVAKQDLMVDENILKLEIKQLRDILNSKADVVLSLAKRKLQLHTAMTERTHEINVHKDMLQAQIKALDTERQKLSAEVHDRFSKIDKLRKRYEIVMISMAPPEGEEEHSQAYYVIKAAQEKEELQRTGDELDAKIRKAEKEIRALENTLRLMNGSNETFRKSLNRVDHSSNEFQEKEQLEANHQQLLDKVVYKRKQVKKQREDLQTMGRNLSTLSNDEHQLLETIEEKQAVEGHMKKDLVDQKAKKDRVLRQSSKLLQEILSSSSKSVAGTQRDIEVRQKKEFGNSVMQQLGQVAAEAPDLAPSIHLLCSQAGLPPPPSPLGSGRLTSSRASSTRTSQSQVSIVSSRAASRTIGMTPMAIKEALAPTGISPQSSGFVAQHRTPGSRASSAGSRASSRASSAASQKGLVPA